MNILIKFEMILNMCIIDTRYLTHAYTPQNSPKYFKPIICYINMSEHLVRPILALIIHLRPPFMLYTNFLLSGRSVINV